MSGGLHHHKSPVLILFLQCALFSFILLSIPQDVHGQQPFEEFLRAFIDAAKSAWERWLQQIRLPRLPPTSITSQLRRGRVISSQLDHTSYYHDSSSSSISNFPIGGGQITTDVGRVGSSEAPLLVSRCARCRLLSDGLLHSLSGAWKVVFWSRNLLITSITDADREIDALEAGQSGENSAYPSTLADWLADPPHIHCAQLFILDAETPITKTEFVYQLPRSSRDREDTSGHEGRKRKSIVGEWHRHGGGFVWQITPGVELQLCAAYYRLTGNKEMGASLASNKAFPVNTTALWPESNLNREVLTPQLPMVNAASAAEFIVFNQIQPGEFTLMPCENFIVLARSDDIPTLSSALRDFLDLQRIDSPFNKLEHVHCA